MKIELNTAEVVTLSYALKSEKANLKKYLSNGNIELRYRELAENELKVIEKLINKLK